MFKVIKQGFVYFVLLCAAFVGVSIRAAEKDYGLEETARAGGLIGPTAPTFGPGKVAGDVVGYLLAFVGVIFFGYMLYGGFLWMTAGGNEEGVKSAQGIIKNSLIGLLIIFLAYIIVRFVLTQILTATGVPQ